MDLVDEIFEEQFPEEVFPDKKVKLNSYNEVSSPKKESGYDKEKWAEQKQFDREIAFELADRTAEVSVSSPLEFKKFLNVLSRFDRYSVTNVLLIMAQRPDATKLGSFDHWKTSGGNIKKGQKGFLVVEPGGKYTKEDGSVGTYYNAKRVFDISQTSLLLPAQKHNYNIRTLIRALINKSPVRIVPCNPDKMPPGRGALYIPKEECIVVRKQMSEMDTFKSLSIELCHCFLAKGDKEYTRQGNVFPAFCVSYVLCQKYGIDNAEYNFDRVPHLFKDQEATEIRSMLNGIRSTSVKLIDDMTKALTPEKKVNTSPER